ncbi:hypothetical protein NQ314_014284 [Rhamnusium bicolor]|uniref:DDE-1 domain-containing protein n=1 Tax=Rhamnusium bicolor TaxID=1586634 RepID=A0AAV8X2R5_9CUCU|nr:hypothetical protein NQ314_014284 [Rhamnusium bicolor]
MDNHDSHLSIEAIDYCRDHGIVILTLPPHTSNRFQPLDKTVFGPFKIYFDQSADNWMLNHPAETITIYDLPELCYKSWDLAATPSNIKSGFLSTGICPYNRNIFKEEDFLGAFVTDRAYKETEPNPDAPSINQDRPLENKENESDINIPSTSLMESEENKKDKEKESSSSEEELELIDNSSDDLNIDEEEEYEETYSIDDGRHAIVKIFRDSLKKIGRNFVAEIKKKMKNGYEVRFLKRQIASNRFFMSDESPAFVPFNEVVIALPKPKKDQRIRFKDMIYFDIDMSRYNLY